MRHETDTPKWNVVDKGEPSIQQRDSCTMCRILDRLDLLARRGLWLAYYVLVTYTLVWLATEFLP